MQCVHHVHLTTYTQTVFSVNFAAFGHCPQFTVLLQHISLVAAISTSSGLAAQSTIMQILSSGDHVVSTGDVYGGKPHT